MKKWKIFIFICILYADNVFAVPFILDKVVAVVDNDVILESDINMYLHSMKYSIYDTDQQLFDDVFLRRKILDWLIMDNMLLQLAQRANIIISDDQLDEVIINIASQNHMTFEQLRQRLVDIGMNYNAYRAYIRKDVMISEVRNWEVRRRITILPQEIIALVKQMVEHTDNDIEFNLSHIVIPILENQAQEQVDKLESLAKYLIKQSKNGIDFDKLAIIFADDQEIQFRQIGWSKSIELPTVFVKYLQGVQKGSIIGPFRSGIGLHIVKVNDIRNHAQKIMVKEVHIRHILLRTSAILSDQQACNKLLNIAEQIKNGYISFSNVAQQISDDLSSANQGGDLGWSCIKDLELPLRNALRYLLKGEISPPIRSSYGWHLIQLIDMREVDYTDEIQKERAYRLLFNHKFAKETENWIQEQCTSSYIKIFEDNV